jgi:4-carboxymuconolactone decarboxylase
LNVAALMPVMRAGDYSPEQATAAQEIARARGERTSQIAAIFGVLLHSPEAARSVSGLGAYCRFGSPLADDLREAVILTVADRLGADYEWQHHLKHAHAAGLTADDISMLCVGELPSSVHERFALAVHLAREVAVPGRDPAELVQQSRTILGDAMTVDVVVTAAYYGMLAAIQRIFNISVEDDALQPPRSTPA